MLKQLAPLAIAAACACLLTGTAARGGSITLDGSITQDAGSAAVDNPALNNIADGDAFTVTLNFAGGLASPANLVLTSLAFSDPAAGATEAAFISGQMQVLAGDPTQFSVLGCLDNCATGNQLALEFQIPAGFLTSSGVTVQAIPSLFPLDLLEDDGATEIQGALAGYSYSGPVQSAAPEPTSVALVGGAMLALLARRRSARSI